ncbi:hypothetical protein ACN28S_30000 [Cystobacter fuscus]
MAPPPASTPPSVSNTVVVQISNLNAYDPDEAGEMIASYLEKKERSKNLRNYGSSVSRFNRYA